jgi:TonB family protein
MNRLQKKCLIATAGSHLLLLLILLVGPGFFTSKPKPDEAQLLVVIPENLIPENYSSGVKNAQPPAPTPPTVQPPEPQPQPPQPKPVVTPPEPKPEPVKPEPEPVKPPDKLSPDELTPVDTKPKTKPHEIKVDLKNKVVRNVPLKNTENTEAENEVREAAKAAKRRAAAIASAAQSIKANSSSATTVEMPGTGSVSYASYASAVKTIYEAAWIPPDDTASDDANTKVSVTIARDGSVISSRILDRSGDSKVDASVQRALDRVTFVRPFPDGSKEKEKTFIINFNLKAKRLLG